MSAKKDKQFRVAVIGKLTDHEWQILVTATRLTTARPRSYTFAPLSNIVPDIYLVDLDLTESQRQWHAARIRHPAPAIFLKADANVTAGNTREFRRPLVPSCLLKLVSLLDEITVEELHFLPELCIGQEQSPTPALQVKNTRSRRFSALVVDDSATVRTQVGLGLKMFGINADFAETAEDALELLDKNSYDIAFLDVVLPGADGYQICKAIKKKGKHTNTSVVMLTSKSSTFDRVKANLAGCDTFLTKPVENAMFQQVVRKYLKQNDSFGISSDPLTAK